MELEAQTLTGAVPPRKNGRYTASLVLAMCAAAGVSYSVASSRSTPIAELSAESVSLAATPGKPVVHAYVDAL